MHNTNENIINLDSILEIKASGSLDISNDLNMPEGKSIAELLQDEKTQTTT